MSLPALYAQPADADSWRLWSFNHAALHYTTLDAVFRQKGQNLDQFCLDPMDPQNLGLWLYQHQVMHNQNNVALGIQGYDLLELNWEDPDSFREWLLLNGDEHQRWAQTLGVG